MEDVKVKSIPGYEGIYEISERGEVISLAYGSTKKPGVLRHNVSKVSGCHTVALSKDNVVRRYSVARLVAEAFVENPDPDKYTAVRTKNGNNDDLRADNLEWFSQGERLGLPENRAKASATRKASGRDYLATAHAKSRRKVCAYDDSGELVATFRSITDANKITRSQNIGQALATGCRSAGYYWKYADGGEL